MFSHQTAERFEKERPSAVGPGSYDLPSTRDARAPVLEGTERWQENSIEVPGPGDYDPKADEKSSDPAGPPPTASTRRSGLEKENRAPSSQRKKEKVLPLRSQSPQAAQATGEASAEARQRQQDLRLASQLDHVRDELKQKTRENKDLQQQVAAKDRKLEELQKRVEDLAADRREAHRRTAEVEGERDAKRRQLHEKEQDLLAQQRKNEHLRLAAEEKCKRVEKREEECKNAMAEAQKLRASVESLQEKLSAAERDRKAADQSRAQQERRGAQLEQGLQEHIAVLEESIRREEGRRRELEERAARTGAEREQGETELAAERRRVEELQHRVAQLEVEMTGKLAEQKELMEQQHQLEDELSAVKARNAAQGEALNRAEEARQELETRAARAEVAAEARMRELAVESAKVAELEVERQRFGEAQYTKQHERLEEAEGQVRVLTRDLEEERERCEDLERQVADLEERERAAVATAQSEEAARLEGLQERAQRAEADAQAAAEEVRRLKEWADEQTLRELTADSHRLEEIKRVREDVTRQVEAARHEVVEENKALQQRLRSLEAGPEGAAALRERLEAQEECLRALEEAVRASEAERADLEVRLESAQREAADLKAELGDTRGALDEERRELENRVAHAEASAALASDDFAEEREQLEAQVKALRIQHETAMATRDEETEASRAAEREAAAQREAALEEALTTSRSLGALCRWRLLAEASATKQFNSQMDEAWGQVRRTVRVWRALANGHERDGSLLTRQGEELERLDAEAEALREQNRQVLISMQLAQQELQWSLAETRRLQDREAAYEGDLLRMSERSAELAGHANPKQKIKHLMDLKAENTMLRQELKKCKQQVAQLEVHKTTAHFFDAVMLGESTGAAALGAAGGGRPQTPRKSTAAHAPMTPGRPSTMAPRTPNRGDRDRDRDPLSALSEDRPEAVRRERAEAVRHARAHRRASERAAVEYQHLAAVVEQVLALHPSRSAVGGGSSTFSVGAVSTVASSGMVTPDRNTSEATGGAEPGALLRRLRELAADLTAGGGGQRRGEQPPQQTPRGPEAFLAVLGSPGREDVVDLA